MRKSLNPPRLLFRFSWQPACYFHLQLRTHFIECRFQVFRDARSVSVVGPLRNRRDLGVGLWVDEVYGEKSIVGYRSRFGHLKI
jgi:hypothetical protein